MYMLSVCMSQSQGIIMKEFNGKLGKASGMKSISKNQENMQIILDFL